MWSIVRISKRDTHACKDKKPYFYHHSDHVHACYIHCNATNDTHQQPYYRIHVYHFCRQNPWNGKEWTVFHVMQPLININTGDYCQAHWRLLPGTLETVTRHIRIREDDKNTWRLDGSMRWWKTYQLISRFPHMARFFCEKSFVYPPCYYLRTFYLLVLAPS